MAHFKSNQRGGLSVDRDSLHASPEFKLQIAALNKLSENPMTLPQNVKDAVERVDYFLAGCAPELADMQTIRAHLMSQEAEIQRIQNTADGNAELYQHELLRTESAESRLAAANALLREAIGWNWLDDGASRPDVMDVLDQAIQSHLQGAGDEA